MPRTAIPPATVVGPYPTLPPAADSLDLVFSAADTVNLNQIALGAAKYLLLLWNNTGGSAYTITLTSVADKFGRTGDITTYSVGIGEFGGILIDRDIWAQTDGNLYLQASNAAVKFLAY